MPRPKTGGGKNKSLKPLKSLHYPVLCVILINIYVTGTWGGNMAKRIFFLLLSLSVLISACGCDFELAYNLSHSSSEASSKTVPPSSIKLPLDSSDSLNPFKAETVSNKNLMPLIYDPLFTVTKNYEPKNVIASRASVDGTKVKIQINKVQFSDKTSVTTADVAYSLEQAADSPLYSAQLANIDDIIFDSQTVQITLKKPDRNFLNCLDTPIVKEGTGENDFPTGSGRYVPNKKNGSVRLKYNEQYGGEKPNYQTIELAEAPESEEIMSEIKTGEITAMFTDLREGETGGLGTKSSSVSLNNMIYIGINPKGVLEDDRFRQALSLSLDRSVILARGYSSRGNAAYLPINPLLNTGEDLSFAKYNAVRAANILDKLGYSKTNINGIRLNGKSPIKFELLINPDNNYKRLTAEAVKSALQDIGISVSVVTAKSFQDFQNKINSGRFELYLGEIKLLSNMDISELLSGELSKHLSVSDKLLEKYDEYLSGKSYSGFAKAFSKQTPFIPLLFKNGIVAYTGNISTELTATPSDVYYNISDWE